MFTALANVVRHWLETRRTVEILASLSNEQLRDIGAQRPKEMKSVHMLAHG